MKGIRTELQSQHETDGTLQEYRDFVVLDECCAMMLAVEYTVEMARLRIRKPTVL